MQEFPGPSIRQTFTLEQIGNPNRLCDIINLSRVKFRLVILIALYGCETLALGRRATGEQYQPLRCSAGESYLGYHGCITNEHIQSLIGK